ncbi:MAG: gas vesicle protein [Chloroflexi bacterium]|nr:gas vesicle protein [Chloroflexota bacterium]
MEMREALKKVKVELSDITGLKPTSVVRAEKNGDGWKITIELLEMSRIPAATDVLGLYDVLLNAQGEVETFDRKGMRLRGEAPKELSV